MTERFRASGLAHLTAVSGQNAPPCLPPPGRCCAGYGRCRAGGIARLIAWFVVLDPGRAVRPASRRDGGLARSRSRSDTSASRRGCTRWPSSELLLTDPLLVRSVGFWLSVGATAGVTMIAPRSRGGWRRSAGWPCRSRHRRCAAGRGRPELARLRSASLIGIAANLARGPGRRGRHAVRPAGRLLAGVPPRRGAVVMLPVGVGVSWVDTIAGAARSNPRPSASSAGSSLGRRPVGAVTRVRRRRPAATMTPPWLSTC